MLMVFCVTSPHMYMCVCGKGKCSQQPSVRSAAHGLSLGSHLVQPLKWLKMTSGELLHFSMPLYLSIYNEANNSSTYLKG